MFVKQRAQHRADGLLTRCVTALFGVGGIAHQQTNTRSGGDGADARQIGAATVDRCEIEFEITRMQDDALRSVHRHRERVGHRVGDRDELDVERTDVAPLVVGHGHEFGGSEQPRLFDSSAGQSERDGRTEHRERHVAQEELQSTHMIFVTMGGHASDDAVGVLAQPREVGQNQIDAMHVGIGEHQAAVDQQDAVVLFDGHAVPADLPQPSEEDDADRCRHQAALFRRASRLAQTFLARSSTKSAGGPMGRRHCPTGTPR